MFAERFDALMNIAEVSNSLLGRDINMNSSHIGRLRSGARPLPKKHEYIMPICLYLANHIKKDYQVNALQNLTGIGEAALSSSDAMASYLEQWLLENEGDISAATGRLFSGFSRIAAQPLSLPEVNGTDNLTNKCVPYLYGNAGKRKAVEQFFLLILKEEKPQTLLLFSDENMDWLYEDPAFVVRWTELFTRILQKRNRARIIHTVSRNMNEMLEAITKWIPIYMTGMVEPYYYTKLRDGLFQRTLFIAPNTAAVISSSVQQDTDGMLNLFLTDRAAVEALTEEYTRYLALCSPVMQIFTEKRSASVFQRTAESLAESEGAAFICCSAPPLFALPEKLVRKLSEQAEDETLFMHWKQSLSRFRKNIKRHRLTLILLDPETAAQTPAVLRLPVSELFSDRNFTYEREQYLMHMDNLKQLESRYENLKLHIVSRLADNTLLYVKEGRGVIMEKTDLPRTAFVINEHNMINAFCDYIEKHLLG